MTDGIDSSELGGKGEGEEMGGPEPGIAPDSAEDDQGRALREMMAAREAWHRERGETPPRSAAPQCPAGSEDEGLQAAERRFITAREAWLRQRGTKPDGE